MLPVLNMMTAALVAASGEQPPGPTLLEFIITISCFAMVWTGCFLWAVRWFVTQHTKAVDKGLSAMSQRFDERVASIGRTIEDLDGRDQELRIAMIELRADMAENYVRREDWVRTSSAIDAKLDQIREHIRERGLVRGNPHTSQEG